MGSMYTWKTFSLFDGLDFGVGFSFFTEFDVCDEWVLVFVMLSGNSGFFFFLGNMMEQKALLDEDNGEVTSWLLHI